LSTKAETGKAVENRILHSCHWWYWHWSLH